MKPLVSLSANASANYLKVAPKPRLLVRITDITTDAEILSFDTETKNAGTISRSIKPFGGIETVSRFTVEDLVLADDFRLCTDATLYNEPEGARRGSGRIISQDMTDYDTARNTNIGSWATPTITVGQQFNPAIGYGVYVGYLQVAVPAGVTSIEEAVIYLKGVSDYSTTDFEIYLVEGNWPALSEEGAMFNDYVGYESSGAYSLTLFSETYNSSEYVTYDATKDDNEAYNLIRLNAAGKAYLISKAGSVAKFAFISKEHADNSAPTGNEYINFEASTAMLKLRYNTKTLDNQRARAYRYYAPFTGTYADMQKIYDGVVDQHTLNNRTLSLTIRKSDLKNNVLIPNTVLRKEDYSFIPEANVGKAIPEVYGDFLTLAEHREGIAYVVDEDNGYTIAHRDYVKALMYDSAAYKGLIAGHDIKAIDTNAALFESGNKVFTLLVADVATITDENNKKIALITRDISTYGSEFPLKLTYGQKCGVISFIPQVINEGSFSSQDAIDNVLKAVNSNAADYYTISPSITQAHWKFADVLNGRSMGIDPIGTLYFCYYTVKQGGGAYDGNLEIYLHGYHDGPSDFSTLYADHWTVTADGWHYHEISTTHIPANKSLSFDVYFATSGLTNTVYISNISLSAGYKVDFKTEFFIACQGRPDDASGTITGTASALIENPSHVIESIARNSMSHATANINTSALDTAATSLANWKFAFQLLEQEKAADLLDRMGEQSKLAVFRDDDDKLTVNMWNATADFEISGTDIPNALDIYADEGRPVITAGIESWTRHPILHDSLLIDQVDSGKVYNSFTLKYRENYASGDYMEVLTIDNGAGTVGSVTTNLVAGDEAYMENSQTIAGLKALTAASYTAMGNTTNTLTYEADFVRDRATAVKLLQHLVEAYTPRRYTVEFDTKENALRLECGDIINIRHRRVYDLFGTITSDRKKWHVTDINHHVKQATITIKAIEVTHGS